MMDTNNMSLDVPDFGFGYLLHNQTETKHPEQTDAFVMPEPFLTDEFNVSEKLVTDMSFEEKMHELELIRISNENISQEIRAHLKLTKQTKMLKTILRPDFKVWIKDPEALYISKYKQQFNHLREVAKKMFELHDYIVQMPKMTYKGYMNMPYNDDQYDAVTYNTIRKYLMHVGNISQHIDKKIEIKYLLCYALSRMLTDATHIMEYRTSKLINVVPNLITDIYYKIIHIMDCIITIFGGIDELTADIQNTKYMLLFQD